MTIHMVCQYIMHVCVHIASFLMLFRIYSNLNINTDSTCLNGVVESFVNINKSTNHNTVHKGARTVLLSVYHISLSNISRAPTWPHVHTLYPLYRPFGLGILTSGLSRTYWNSFTICIRLELRYRMIPRKMRSIFVNREFWVNSGLGRVLGW